MRLVLDANVVRSFGHGEISVGPFTALREEGVSLHLADGATAELLSQLLEGRFLWRRWLVARRELLELLDPDEPVLLGGRQGLYRAGIRGATQQVSATDITTALERSNGWWRALLRAESVADIMLPVSVGTDVLTLTREAPAAQLRGFKSGWIRTFSTERLDDDLLTTTRSVLPRRGDGIEQLDAVVRTIAKNLDKKNGGLLGLPASRRLDAMIRVFVLLQLRSMRSVEPYDARRNQNDSFDHDLLRYLAYPAAVCSADLGIRRKMRDAGCWQAAWVVHPNELASASVRQQLRTFGWDAQSVVPSPWLSVGVARSRED